jgi:uncharacterized protein YdaU (DUF1376 family)
MSKDPAFLFYPGDWNLGTMHMTLLEKGAYIELLMLQFARGKFTLAQAKHMLNGSFSETWTTISEKFETDGTYYWNTRLKLEKDKRVMFTESRRLNALTPKKEDEDMQGHMEGHMENVNKDKNINKNKSKKIKIPTIEEVKQYFKESGYSEQCAVNAFEYYTDLDWHDKNDNPVLNWKMKMRTVWFKDEHRLQETTDFSPLNAILNTLKK